MDQRCERGGLVDAGKVILFVRIPLFPFAKLLFVLMIQDYCFLPLFRSIDLLRRICLL